MSDYEQGRKDCSEGKPHVNGSEEYNQGYGDQYLTEQINDALTGE